MGLASGALRESMCCGKSVCYRQSSRAVVRVCVLWGGFVCCRERLRPV